MSGTQADRGTARRQGQRAHLVVLHPLPAELRIGCGHGLHHKGRRHKAAGGRPRVNRQRQAGGLEEEQRKRKSHFKDQTGPTTWQTKALSLLGAVSWETLTMGLAQSEVCVCACACVCLDVLVPM